MACTPSGIATRQNEPALQRLLKARQWRWKVAVRWQMLQFAVVLLAPLLAVTLGMMVLAAKPYISFAAVCFTLLDVAWVDRAYKASLKTAAQASELFDTELLSIPWNGLITGKKPTPEETERAERKWDSLKNTFPTLDWYAGEVDRAPLGLARVICQRTNLAYDSDLRRLYRVCLDVAAALVSVTVLAIGFYAGMEFSAFVLAGWVPAAPFFIWALRERFRQAAAVETNTPVVQDAEKLIEAVIAKSCDDKDCVVRARHLQDAIFIRRSTTVLLFPGIYRLRRPNAEREMHAGVHYWMDRAQLA